MTIAGCAWLSSSSLSCLARIYTTCIRRYMHLTLITQSYVYHPIVWILSRIIIVSRNDLQFLAFSLPHTRMDIDLHLTTLFCQLWIDTTIGYQFHKTIMNLLFSTSLLISLANSFGALETARKPCLQDRKARFQMKHTPGVDRKCGRKKYNARRCKKPIVGGGTVRDFCPVTCNVCVECKNGKGKYQFLNGKRPLTCKQLAKRGNCLEIVSEFDETNVFDYCPLACNTCPGVL